jgi:peptide/nickel transport system substrate-binding protein/oligopeptide transport system substrate-binding protein
MRLGLVLLAALAAATLAGSARAAGETIRVEDSTQWSVDANGLGLLDPVVYGGNSQQILYLTCARLYNYADLPGSLGLVLQPEVASGYPTVSADGLTYTFTIQSGFGFSPPSTEEVTADSFVRAIERQQNPDIDQGGEDPNIASASANGNQLVITLNAPQPNLVEVLAESAFCAVPSDAPLDAYAPPTMASAGPYYVASATPDEVVLEQNPNYGGTRVRNLGEIDWFYDVSVAHAISDVESRAADYAPNLNGADIGSLNSAYGPDSQAAADGHQQYFASPEAATWFIDLNTLHGPLADPRLRQAIAYAVDRTGFAWLTTLATPTDQYLPPGFPGFEDWSIYPFTPNLIAAMSLASEAKVSPSNPVTLHAVISAGVNGINGAGMNTDSLITLLQQDLSPLGINLDVQQVEGGVLFGQVLPDPSAFDVSFFGWVADYADPYDFLNLLFDSSAPGAADFSYYDAFDSQLEQAAAMTPGPDRDATYAQLDHDIAVQAPMVPLFNADHPDLFSARIGCQVYQPLYGMNLNELCVRGAAPEPAGGTLSTGSTTSTAAPLQTSVTTPNAGQVSIQQGVATGTVTNYQLLPQQLTITAPDATVAVPLRLVFTLDSSLVGSTDPATIDVLRDGVAVAACADGSGQANPDPCLASRTVLAGGDLQLVVLSSHASQWNFGVVVDHVAPVLVVPASFAVNATGPGGAVVTYTASATDNVDGAVTPTCSKSSGSLFPIGDTVVTCSAVDAHHNVSAPQSFTVHVEGAAEQLGDLLQTVVQRKLGPGFSLSDKVRALLALVAANHKPAFCVAMKALDLEVKAQAGKKLAAADATALRADIARIESVEGC